MSASQHTFGLYFYNIVDRALPADAPQRGELVAMLAALNERPLEELTNEAIALFEILATVPDSHKLMFQLGSQVPLTAYSPLAMPMKFAPTIGEMLQFLARFVHTAAPILDVRYEPIETGARISIGTRETLSPEAESFIGIGGLVVLATEMAAITGKRANFKKVELRQCSKPAEALFKSMLNIKPEVGADRFSAEVDQSILDIKNPFADPLTFENYVEQFAAAAKERQETDSVKAEVKRRIIGSIDEPPRFDDMAASLNMTPRQLRFALSKEHANYRELLQECRIEFARAQLANPRMSVAKLAHRLGYSDVTAFNHGFKRWTGMSPTQYQRSLLSGGS